MTKPLAASIALAVLLFVGPTAGAIGGTYTADVDTLYTSDGDTVLVRSLDKADDGEGIVTFGGASTGYYVEGGGVRDGQAHTSYWAGFRVATLGDGASWWLAYQSATNDALDVSGDGALAILSTAHQDWPRWHLLVGGGFLDNFALDGDGSRTTALTVQAGIFFDWSEMAGVGSMARAFDEGARFGYVIDVGFIVWKPDELLMALVGR